MMCNTKSNGRPNKIQEQDGQRGKYLWIEQHYMFNQDESVNFVENMIYIFAFMGFIHEGLLHEYVLSNLRVVRQFAKNIRK